MGVKASKLENVPSHHHRCREDRGDRRGARGEAKLDTHHCRLIPSGNLSQLLLTPEQRRIGSAIVDFGAETTTVCYFNHGVLESLRVLPMGGTQMTHDPNVAGDDPEEAERVKTTEGRSSRPAGHGEDICKIGRPAD